MKKPKTMLTELATAARDFLKTKDRYSVYGFVDAVYAAYWAVRTAKRTKAYKQELARAGKVEVSGKPKLASVMIKAAGRGKFTSSSVAKWAGLIDTAYKRGVLPRDFVKAVKKAGGVALHLMRHRPDRTERPIVLR